MLAPTGVAAHNVDGMTIHSAFGLNCLKREYTALTGIPAQKLKKRFDGKLFIIIDEHSMVSSRLLSTLEKRLHELRPHCPDVPFAGFYVYMFGDIRQLVPVAELPMYTNPVHIKHPEILHGINLFRNMGRYFQLTQCQRQREDQPFIKFLNKLANGNIDDEDYEQLMLRREILIPEWKRQEFKNAIHLYSKRDDVKEHNLSALRKLNTPVARILAVTDTNVAQPKQGGNSGINDELHIAVGCRVMLRRNLCTEGGLVNGTIGTVQAIVYNNGVVPPKQPAYILVDFDSYKGPYFFQRFFPIVPQLYTWSKSGITHTTLQFPLSLAHAVTIYKSQGLTITCGTIDIGTREFAAGSTYVALSRFKSIDQFMLKILYSKNRWDITHLKQHIRKMDALTYLQTKYQ